MLYNMNIELDIPNLPRFKVHAILDTGATTCCVDEDAVPKEALEQNTSVVHFSVKTQGRGVRRREGKV